MNEMSIAATAIIWQERIVFRGRKAGSGPGRYDGQSHATAAGRSHDHLAPANHPWVNLAGDPRRADEPVLGAAPGAGADAVAGAGRPRRRAAGAGPHPPRALR